MIDKKLVAERLLQVQAVKLRPMEPFTWASGLKSPIYCDNRKILSYPDTRDFIKCEMSSIILDKFSSAQSIGGVATAGIAWGALISDQLRLPFIYIRPKPKEHGLRNQVEGEFKSGDKIVVIEDLISTGGSSLMVARTLTSLGLEVLGIVSIFTYGLEVAENEFNKSGIKLYALTDYDTLITLAKDRGMVSEDQFETLLNWRQSPLNWKSNS